MKRLRGNFLKFNDELEKLYFVNCSFSSYYVLSTFNGVSKVGFIKCILSYDILKELLCSVNPHNNFDVLDLTGNELGEDPNLFVKILHGPIVMYKTVKEFILVDNGFDNNIISLLPSNVFKKIYI